MLRNCACKGPDSGRPSRIYEQATAYSTLTWPQASRATTYSSVQTFDKACPLVSMAILKDQDQSTMSAKSRWKSEKFPAHVEVRLQP